MTETNNQSRQDPDKVEAKLDQILRDFTQTKDRVRELRQFCHEITSIEVPLQGPPDIEHIQELTNKIRGWIRDTRADQRLDRAAELAEKADELADRADKRADRMATYMFITVLAALAGIGITIYSVWKSSGSST